MEKWLLVGSGAREHAIAKALTKNKDVLLYLAMELPNPGIKKLSQDVLSTETDHGSIIEFCKHNNIHYCVIGPEKPLNEGLVQDHKRAFNNDKGPNTGGMGSYTCNNGLLPFVTENDYRESVAIGKEVIQALKKEEALFKGILYAQLMITKNGPKIIEFNARFGDPEAINMLALLETSFTNVCKAMINGTLDKINIVHRNTASVMVYIVHEGYGVEPQEGDIISLNEDLIQNANAHIYYASCVPLDTRDGIIKIQTTKARTLGIFSKAATTEQALQNVLSAIRSIEGKYCYRTDIGSPEILQNKVKQMDAIRSNSRM